MGNSGNSGNQNNQQKQTKQKTQIPKIQDQKQVPEQNPIQIYEFQFNKQLNDFDLTIESMKSDGNCLFRCFADQYERNENEHLYYRNLACEYMIFNTAEFELFVDDNLQSYVEKVRKNGTWGSDIEIIALCRALNVNVIIFQLEKDPIVFISEQCVDVYKQKNVIIAYYEEFLHYNSVKLKSIASRTNNKANDYLYYLCQKGLQQNQLQRRQQELIELKQIKQTFIQ